MDNYLRQLLSMLNMNPAPGRVQPMPNTTAQPQNLGKIGGGNPTPTDLGRVGGNDTAPARIPQGQYADNGRGSMEMQQPAPMAPQQPGFDPAQTQVNRGPQMDPEQTQINRGLQDTSGEALAQTQVHRGAPVHLHITPEVLQAIIKRGKGQEVAEDSDGT
jgi:hypothetical protein